MEDFVVFHFYKCSHGFHNSSRHCSQRVYGSFIDSAIAEINERKKSREYLARHAWGVVRRIRLLDLLRVPQKRPDHHYLKLLFIFGKRLACDTGNQVQKERIISQPGLLQSSVFILCWSARVIASSLPLCGSITVKTLFLVFPPNSSFLSSRLLLLAAC